MFTYVLLSFLLSLVVVIVLNYEKKKPVGYYGKLLLKEWLSIIILTVSFFFWKELMTLFLVLIVLPIYMLYLNPTDIQKGRIFTTMGLFALLAVLGIIWLPWLFTALAITSMIVVLAFLLSPIQSYVITKFAQSHGPFFTVGPKVNNYMFIRKQNKLFRDLENVEAMHQNRPGGNYDPAYPIGFMLPNKAWAHPKHVKKNGIHPAEKSGDQIEGTNRFRRDYDPAKDDPFDFQLGIFNGLIDRWERQYNVYFTGLFFWMYDFYPIEETEYEIKYDPTGEQIIGIDRKTIKSREMSMQKRIITSTEGDTGAPAMSRALMDKYPDLFGTLDRPEKIQVLIYSTHFVDVLHPRLALIPTFYEEAWEDSADTRLHDLVAKQNYDDLIKMKGDGPEKNGYLGAIYGINGKLKDDQDNELSPFTDEEGMVMMRGVCVTKTNYIDSKPLGELSLKVVNAGTLVRIAIEEGNEARVREEAQKDVKDLRGQGDALELQHVAELIEKDPTVLTLVKLKTLGNFKELRNLGNAEILLNIDTK